MEVEGNIHGLKIGCSSPVCNGCYPKEIMLLLACGADIGMEAFLTWSDE